MSEPPAVSAPRTGHDRRTARERIERRLYRAAKKLRQRFGAPPPRSHLFVAGVQRSGTNMLMEMLEWNRHTDVYHETNARAFTPGYEMRDTAVIHALAARSRAPFFIIKCLCELDRLRALLDDFAPARAIWIVRDYHDSSRSAVRSFGNFVPQLRRLARDRSDAAWRGRGMSDATQALLREMTNLELSELDGAALMWYYRNILYFEQGLDADERVAVIRYEDLVRAPQQTMAHLGNMIDLPDCTPWMTRYSHATSIGWKRETILSPAVEEVCGRLMGRFGSISVSKIVQNHGHKLLL